MVRCNYCGAEYQDINLFNCPSCGARLEHISRAQKTKETAFSVVSGVKSNYLNNGITRLVGRWVIKFVLTVISIIFLLIVLGGMMLCNFLKSCWA